MRTEYSEKYITMGLKIAYYRKKAGYTQEVFAEKIGKSVNFMSQVEGTGTVRGVSLETLFKMADVLGIPPSKLLEDDCTVNASQVGTHYLYAASVTVLCVSLFSLPTRLPPCGAPGSRVPSVGY